MANQAMGDMLNEIGQHVADFLGNPLKDVFVFIEAGDNWSGGEIYQNQAETIESYEFPDIMSDLILNMWEAAPADKKWSVILYDIKDGEFSAEFLYPEIQIDEDGEEYDIHDDILDAALLERFGEKTITYPNEDDDDWHELTEEDLAEVEVIEVDPNTGLPINPEE